MARLSLEESPSNAVNRCYYACFYTASAVLCAEGRQFVRHTGLRSAVHKHLVQTGRVSKDIGRAYDSIMKARESADNDAMESWTEQHAQETIASAELVVAALRQLLGSVNLG